MKKLLFLAFACSLGIVNAQTQLKQEYPADFNKEKVIQEARQKGIPDSDMDAYVAAVYTKYQKAGKHEFDEQKARQTAAKKGVPARVMDEFISGQKIRFENEHNKVHLNQPKKELVMVADVNSNRVINQTVIQASQCTNSDLASNDYSNWTGDIATSCSPGTQYPVASWLGTGINGNNGTPIQFNNSPCSNSTGYQVIHNQPIGALSANSAIAFANGYDDNCKNPNTGFYDLSLTPANGTNSIRLSSAYENYTCAKLVYPLTVTAQNAQFTYQFAVVLDDGNHPVGEQPSFLFAVKDINGNVISGGGIQQQCVQYNVDATGALNDTTFIQSSQPCNGSIVYYRKWRTVTIDLTSQIGSTVYAEFQTLDCPWSGHYGYAYLSAHCGSLTASVSGFCGGVGSATMQAPPGFASYQWYGPNNLNPIAGATSSVYTANPAVNNDVFTVDCITLQGCTTKLTVTVASSNILATASAAPTCRGGSTGTASVSVSGGTQYSYLWTPGSYTTTAISGQLPGNYSVTVHDLTGNCPDTTVAVNIGQINPPLQTAVDTLCGTYVVLNAPQPGTNYTWYDNTNTNTGVTTYSYAVTNGSGGQGYTATYINPSTGCLDSIKTTLTQVNINFSYVPSAPCNGGNNGSITVNPGQNSFSVFDWTMTGTQPASGTNVSIPPNLQINSLPGGNYTISINPSGNTTCTYTMAVTLTEGVIPPPTLDTLKGCALDNISIPTNTVSGNTHSWWSGSTSLGSAYPYVTTGVVQGAVYTDTIRNSFGCISVYKAYLKVKSFKVVITSPEKIRCHDDSTGKLKVTANQEINGPLGTPYTFNWNYPNPYPDPAPVVMGTGVPQSSQVNNLHAGTYTCVVTSGNCVATATYNLTNPALLPDDSLYAAFCPKDSLVWLSVEDGHPKYTWLQNGVPIAGNNNDSLQVLTPDIGEYWCVYTIAGCYDTARILFTTPAYHAFRPDKIVNIFTPNGDKRNDTFYPFYDENITHYQIDKQMEDYSIVIYNRWGKKVYESNSYINPWNGDVEGTPQNDGTYYYILSYKSNCSTKADIIEKHGFVQLLR